MGGKVFEVRARARACEARAAPLWVLLGSWAVMKITGCARDRAQSRCKVGCDGAHMGHVEVRGGGIRAGVRSRTTHLLGHVLRAYADGRSRS